VTRVSTARDAIDAEAQASAHRSPNALGSDKSHHRAVLSCSVGCSCGPPSTALIVPSSSVTVPCWATFSAVVMRVTALVKGQPRTGGSLLPGKSKHTCTN
jgi:hypothetical protein